MKKIFSLILSLALMLSLCACSGGVTVSVIPVSMVNGGGSSGFLDRCAGKVVSGETEKVTKDANQKVLEVYVKEGDMVEAGDKLFAYDAAAMELELEKAELELKNLENTIESAKAEVEELEKAKSMVYITNQLSYTIRIDTKNADIREAEYNKAIKAREIEQKKAALEATEIFASLSGRIMSVNDTQSSGDSYYYDGGSSDNSFITIMDISHYRVQGNINELNLGSLSEGMRVLVRSRSDESRCWTGTISGIDWNNPVKDENNGYYYMGSSDEMTSSSKYPFYIELDSTEGLTLGQHVVIEPDYGQGELGEGLWLPSYYLCDADSRAYVWAASASGKLEKRSVTLGEYNPDTDLYQISGGLSLTDYIAMPTEELRAGSSVVRYGEQGYDDGSGEGGSTDEPVEAAAMEVG